MIAATPGESFNGGLFFFFFCLFHGFFHRFFHRFLSFLHDFLNFVDGFFDRLLAFFGGLFCGLGCVFYGIDDGVSDGVDFFSGGFFAAGGDGERDDDGWEPEFVFHDVCWLRHTICIMWLSRLFNDLAHRCKENPRNQKPFFRIDRCSDMAQFEAVHSEIETSSAEQRAISVTQLLRRIRNVLEINVGDVWIEGEVSNLRKQASGHWYFSLKDEAAQIQCAMFGARRREGSEALMDGAKVRVFAEATVYEARGQLQMIVKKAEKAGQGDLQARFEALKRKLAEEGLFDATRKKSLPPFPATIGIVTSPTGAAIQDILNVLTRRAPWVRPVLFPVRVQGDGAAREIARAIEELANPETFGHPRCDVLIVGRGGGSLEDLWCFNEEVVARAIFACPIPILSAVGHEIDFTIADFVADQRAPTPSAAAELAVPDTATLREKLVRLHQRLHRHTDGTLTRARLELNAIRNTLLARDAARPLEQWMMRVDSIQDRLASATRSGIEDRERRLREIAGQQRILHPARILERTLERAIDLHARAARAANARLDSHSAKAARLHDMLRALGPESAFKRGFSVTTAADGSVIRSAGQARTTGEIITRFPDGHVRSKVLPEKSSS